MITKKLIKPISKYGIANIDLNNYYNKSEIDNKITTINGDINTIRNDLGDLGNEVNTNTNNIATINNNIPNYLVKNTTNTITTNSLLTKSNSGELSLATMNWKTQKTISYNHIQSSGAFRNYITHKITMKHLNNPVSNLFVLEARNTNEGIFLTCENNLLTFTSGTTINNVATPTSDNQCANKSYVDSSITTLTNEITTIKQEQTTQNQQIATKQDILSAGNNITISNNTISANVDLSNYYTRSEVDSLIKTITFGSQATFHYVDGLNANTQRYRWYRVDTSSTPLNANNCLNIEYKTTDPKEITFSYKWESDTSILLTFCKINGQQDYRAIGTLIAKYI